MTHIQHEPAGSGGKSDLHSSYTKEATLFLINFSALAFAFSIV